MLLEKNKPPKRARFVFAGKNPTTHGVLCWTKKSALCVSREVLRRGVMLPIDIEHGAAFAKPGDAPRMAGYAKITPSADGCDAEFRWSALGVQQIEDGERLYLSPEYAHVNGEIVGIVRLSLVSDPATLYAKCLASARIGGLKMDLEQLLAALGQILNDTESDDASKVERCRDLMAALSAAAAADTDTEASEETIVASADGDEEAIEKIALSVARKLEEGQKRALLSERGAELDPAVFEVAKTAKLSAVQRLLASAAARSAATHKAKPEAGGKAPAAPSKSNVVGGRRHFSGASAKAVK